MADNWLSFEENSATFSSKGVDVDTGRALWYYQKTLSMNPDAKRTVELDLFYEAAPKYEHYETGSSGGQRAGVANITVGLLVSLIGVLVISKEAEEEEDAKREGLPYDPEDNIGGYTLGAGVTTTVAGIIILVVSNILSPDTIDVPATYAPPSKILCVTKDVEPPFLPTKERKQESGDSSSFTFEQSAAGDDDKKRQITEKLIQMTTEDFVKELNSMTNRR